MLYLDCNQIFQPQRRIDPTSEYQVCLEGDCDFNAVLEDKNYQGR